MASTFYHYADINVFKNIIEKKVIWATQVHYLNDYYEYNPLNRLLEKSVEDKLNTGRYKSASEVFREALRLLEERDEMYQARLDDLRHAIEIGRQGESKSF